MCTCKTGCLTVASRRKQCSQCNSSTASGHADRICNRQHQRSQGPACSPGRSRYSACGATHSNGGVGLSPRPVVLAEVAVASLHLDGGVGVGGEGLQDIIADLYSRGMSAKSHSRRR